MRAVSIQSAGGPATLVDLPVPRVAPGEALVKITAASVNPVDLHVSSGTFFDGPPRTPYIPGMEAVGVVERGTALAPGTRVRVELVHPGYGRDGTLAEYVVIPESAEHADRASQAQAFPVGDQFDDAYLAALGVTSWTALSVLDRVREVGGEVEGATVLVLAATGSIGSIVIQLAKRLGASRVIAAGRDPSRLENLFELGADATVHLDDDVATLRDRFVEAAQGKLDIVLEPLWGTPARAAMEALSAEGVLINFGNLTGVETDLPAQPLRNNNVRLAGYSGALTVPEQRRTAFGRLLELSAVERLRLPVKEVSLDEIAALWPMITASAGVKYVVRPDR